jgi:hypothetical protein
MFPPIHSTFARVWQARQISITQCDIKLADRAHNLYGALATVPVPPRRDGASEVFYLGP